MSEGKGGVRRKKASLSSRSNAHRKPLAEVWRRAGGVCFVCRDPVELEEATREHMLPAVLGGRAVWENLAVSHESCNRDRTKRYDQYAQVWARADCCRLPLPRRALLRCYADPVPITVLQVRLAIASAAAAADLGAEHECITSRSRGAKHRAKLRAASTRRLDLARPLIGAVE